MIQAIISIAAYPIKLAVHSLDGDNSPVEFLLATMAAILLVLFATFSADLGFPPFVTEITWDSISLSAVVGFCVSALVFWINAVDTFHVDNVQRGDIGRMASAFARIFICCIGALAYIFFCFVAVVYGLIYGTRAIRELASSMDLKLGLVIAGLVAAIAILGLRHIGETMPHNRRN